MFDPEYQPLPFQKAETVPLAKAIVAPQCYAMTVFALRARIVSFSVQRLGSYAVRDPGFWHALCHALKPGILSNQGGDHEQRTLEFTG